MKKSPQERAQEKRERQEQNTCVSFEYTTRLKPEIDSNISTYKKRQLANCQAWVLENKDTNFIFLKSYDTIIAAYDKETEELFDFLYLVYGHSSTSIQHYFKFYRLIDDVFGVVYEYRYKGEKRK